MVVGFCPFTEAESSKDKNYKEFCNRKQKYWDYMKQEMQKKELALSDDLIGLLTNMLHKNPNARCDINDIKEHSWFKGFVPENEFIQTYMT